MGQVSVQKWTHLICGNITTDFNNDAATAPLPIPSNQPPNCHEDDDHTARERFYGKDAYFYGEAPHLRSLCSYRDEFYCSSGAITESIRLGTRCRRAHGWTTGRCEKHGGVLQGIQGQVADIVLGIVFERLLGILHTGPEAS